MGKTDSSNWDQGSWELTGLPSVSLLLRQEDTPYWWNEFPQHFLSPNRWDEWFGFFSGLVICYYRAEGRTKIDSGILFGMEKMRTREDRKIR